MKRLRHLQIEEFPIAAGWEWQNASPTWRLLMIRSGAAYSLGEPEARQLEAGELLVVAPKLPVVIRASLLGTVTVAGISFDPELTCGVLTLLERQRLEQPAPKEHQVRFLPSTHRAATLMSELLATDGLGQNLRSRVGVLGIVAAALDDELKSGAPALSLQPKTALERFQELVGRMPDGEFIKHKPEELAHLCGCSPRHFGRLFHDYFGVSARERQTELRLLRARQLLSDSDEKVVQVAMESGYKNLSLFNSLFKRKFHMTPSEWRKKSARILTRPAVLAGLVCQLFLTQSGWAGESPAAAPATSSRTNAAPAFEVKGYNLEGNTLLDESVTDPILKPYTGPAVSFDEIRKALGALQLAYRQRGYVTVGVGLPPQQLTNGIVTFKVTEGRLAEVRVVGNRHFSTKNVLRALPSVETNQILNGLVFQQDLDRANANRDRQIYPVISPGPDPGTSVLELRVKDRPPYHGRVEVNNYGTPGTPDLRMDVSAVVNNLWQLEHQFGFQYGFSPGYSKEGDYAFYDLPLVANYSAFYRVPLAPLSGNHHEVSPAAFGYDESARRFVPPPAIGAGELIVYASRSSSDTGHQLQSETLTPPVVPPEGTLQVSDRVFSRILNPTEDIGFRLTKPIDEWKGWKFSGSAGLDFKKYNSTQTQNRVFQATVFVPTFGTTGPPFTQFASPPTETSRTLETGTVYLPASFGFTASRNDALGSTVFTLNQSLNLSHLYSSAVEYQAATGSTNTSGYYYIVSSGLSREQKLWHEWGVRLSLDGQWASEPLISTEQYGLGGVAGVRGYRPGQEYGDSGWRAICEPHTPWYKVGMVDGTVPLMVRGYTFLDYGQVSLKDPGLRESPLSMCGTGIGVDATVGPHLESKLLVSVPLLSVPGRDAGSPLFLFSLGVQF
jgi:hemolysin activation/secretion protein/AraC-like DNA-binding protein